MKEEEGKGKQEIAGESIKHRSDARERERGNALLYCCFSAALASSSRAQVLNEAVTQGPHIHTHTFKNARPYTDTHTWLSPTRAFYN